MGAFEKQFHLGHNILFVLVHSNVHTGCPVEMDNLGQTPFEAHRVNFFIWLFYDEMTVRALGYYEVLKK